MNPAGTDIVVTGLAAISAAGVGTDPLREALRSGVSRLQPIPAEVLGEDGHFWGKPEDFRPSDYMSPLKARKFDRCSLLAVVATGMALKSAGIAPGSFDPSRVGIVLGCGFGGIANAEEFLTGYFRSGTEGLVPMLFPNIVPNASASNASIEHKLNGPNVTTIQRFCSAESALLMASRFLEEDRADVIITGGVDEISPCMVRSFKSIGQLRRYGAGFGEGAGLLVLEKGPHARSRGAGILATLGAVRTVGLLAKDREEEGMQRLFPEAGSADVVGLSGTASWEQRLLNRLPSGRRLDVGSVVGRSLAMGGIAMAGLVLELGEGDEGLHFAASPEGPYYAIEFSGGDSVRS